MIEIIKMLQKTVLIYDEKCYIEYYDKQLIV